MARKSHFQTFPQPREPRFAARIDAMTSFTAAGTRIVDKRQSVASVTVPIRHCCSCGLEKSTGRSRQRTLSGRESVGTNEEIYGSFSNAVGDIISLMAPQPYQNDNSSLRDYPWRRRAYDRTLSCPDLARAINDFLSSNIDFAPDDDIPVRLCA